MALQSWNEKRLLEGPKERPIGLQLREFPLSRETEGSSEYFDGLRKGSRSHDYSLFQLVALPGCHCRNR